MCGHRRLRQENAEMAKTDPSAVMDTYLKGLRDGRAAGVPEASLYGPLQRLLNEVGRGCRPSVTAVMHPKKTTAGIPDGGLFASHQLGRAGGPGAAFSMQPPTHGVIEAKPIEDD